MFELTTEIWLGLLASVGHLALAIVIATRPNRSTLSKLAVLLFVDMFVWNSASTAFRHTGDDAWHWLDVTFSPLTPAFAFHFVLVFVGRARELRRLVWAGYALFTALAVSSVAAFGLEPARDWVESDAWSYCFLALELPLLLFGTALLARHARVAAEQAERIRARLLIAAIAIGAALGSTELSQELFDLPALGSVGSLICSGLIGLIVLRLHLFGRDASASTWAYGTAIAVLLVGAYAAVANNLATRPATLLVGVMSVTGVLLFVLNDLRVEASQHQGRRQRLLLMGRFSTQMAHDLKNPLAAMKGALDFLVEERNQGRSIDDQREFLELLTDQVDRIHRTIDKYQRLASVDPDREPVDTRALVTSVLALQPSDGPASVVIERALDDDTPSFLGDHDLMAMALDNVVRNAREAMPDGGVLAVRTAAGEGPLAGVVIEVEDEGVGMNPRERELAFDELFTTKADGSGLGLPHVKRVVEAHGGSVSIDTEVGRGTLVRIELPALE